MNEDKFNIEDISELESGKKKKPKLLYSNVFVRPKPSELEENYWIEVNGKSIGKILKVNNENTFTVESYKTDSNGDEVAKNISIIKIEPSYTTHSSFTKYVF